MTFTWATTFLLLYEGEEKERKKKRTGREPRSARAPSVSRAASGCAAARARQVTPLPLSQRVKEGKGEGERKFVPTALGCDLYCPILL